jgi:hypothetical protein
MNSTLATLEYEHAGLLCRLKLLYSGTNTGTHKFRMHWCGYVQVPGTHPLFGEPERVNTEGLSVHGGVTYNQFEEDGHYWIGFDCSHWGDGENPNQENWKDQDYVTQETNTLAEQIQKLVSR